MTTQDLQAERITDVEAVALRILLDLYLFFDRLRSTKKDKLVFSTCFHL